jgi:hypothetical protein
MRRRDKLLAAAQPPDVRKGSVFPRLTFSLSGRLCLPRVQAEAEPREDTSESESHKLSAHQAA